MTGYWFAGAAAFALMTGIAAAQVSSDTTTSTQSTTTTLPAPPADSYSERKTQHTIDSNGVETDKSQTYKSGPDGTAATSASQTTSGDGSEKTTSHSDRTVTPAGTSTTAKTTTETIDH